MSGKLSKKYNSFSNPKFEEYYGDPSKKVSGKLIPIYPETKGISSKWISNKIKYIFTNLNFNNDFHDPIPANIRKKYNYLDQQLALKEAHFPENDKLLKQARDTLALTEMLEVALKLEENRKIRKEKQAHQLFVELEDINTFINSLPFQLTTDQKTVFNEIKQDLTRKEPMFRLLNGDVGSGKTIIALLSSLITIQNGYSVIIMAPTTVLAKQHYKTFINLLQSYPEEIDVELNISSSKKRLYITDGIKPKIIIGTHALLFEHAIPNNTALIIIDEEHRFGVNQRSLLRELSNKFNKNNIFPHYLSMTATPIPRTLSQIIYGDMDISYIKTMPFQKKPTKTHYITPQKRIDMFKWLANQIKNDPTIQAFIIYPLIEDSENFDALSLEESYKKLTSDTLRGISCSIIHGKMSDAEKEKVLNDFKDLKYNILFATTVIEVGIDIPNASIMIIENAERFGLAQLHQLRGRVGRGDKEGTCFVLAKQSTPEIKERLTYFANHTSGFDIAQFDLEHRGPGEVFGTIQTGIPRFKIADIFDLDLLEKAKIIAKEILKTNYNRE